MKNPPPERKKKKSFSGRRGGGRGGEGMGGLWLWFMTSKVSRQCSDSSPQIPESPVLSRGMLMTSPAVKSCSCPLTLPPARNPLNPARDSVQDHGQRQAEVPVGLRGEKARPGFGSEGGQRGEEEEDGGAREEVSRSQAVVN
ncbi:Hypothetical predicted protein [Xyrichtys novacula]|uniref:Uncharacterized protein n=1 Tax=Xyrichtys novacula TaxID=13765 RepID=A0AAV1FDQ0_XYRNO|nr:Hypothetical predicted protein [Xyrichtys novacula]